MTARRRRALVLLGLALLLGGLAASDVSRRQAALARQLGPSVDVVVAAHDLRAGRRIAPEDLATRAIPARYAPEATPSLPEELVGRRVAVDVPESAFLTGSQLEVPRSAPTLAVGRGQRPAQLVGVGSPDLVRPGVRVDVLVTRGDGPDGGGGGRAELALEDLEVLAAAPVAPEVRDGDSGLSRVAVTLRVTQRQAVLLGAVQDFARQVRLLPRAPGDTRRGGRLVVPSTL